MLATEIRGGQILLSSRVEKIVKSAQMIFAMGIRKNSICEIMSLKNTCLYEWVTSNSKVCIGLHKASGFYVLSTRFRLFLFDARVGLVLWGLRDSRWPRKATINWPRSVRIPQCRRGIKCRWIWWFIKYFHFQGQPRWILKTKPDCLD